MEEVIKRIQKFGINAKRVSPEQLVELTKRPSEYDEILNSKEKIANED